MPNKTWNMGVDLIPSTTATYNIGNSTKKWIINGYTLGDACEKGIDSSITDSTTSTAIPTSQAVASYVAEKSVSVSVNNSELIITTSTGEA